MSRLDEAETRFAEAMKALETALERRLAAASNSEAEDSGAGDREPETLDLMTGDLSTGDLLTGP
jgi:hypothetical protein